MLHDVQLPETGQLVHIRQRRYVVVDTELQSKLPPNVLSTKPLHHHHLITLSSVEDDGLGEDLQVIWEIEPGASTIEKTPRLNPLASIRHNAWIPFSTLFVGVRRQVPT